MEAYLFGAGASRGYKGSKTKVQPPLAKDCFKVFNDLAIAADPFVRVGHLVNYVWETRGIHALEFAEWNEDIESFLSEVVTRIETSLKKPARDGKIESIILNQVHDQTVFLFNCILNEIQNGRVATDYRRFLKKLNPGDSLITFNWDCLLDRVLWESGEWSPDDGYDLKFKGIFEDGWRAPRSGCRSRWKLLKLHGSTNWLMPYRTLDMRVGTRRYVNARIPATDQAVFAFIRAKKHYPTYENRSRTGYSPFSYFYYPPDIPYQELETRSAGGRVQVSVIMAGDVPNVGKVKTNANRGTSMPMIIPPVQRKEYDMAGGVLDRLWARAERDIGRCQRLNIIGYSFPPTDLRPWGLLKKAVSARKKPFPVRVVDPYPSALVKRLRDCFGKRIQLEVHEQTFEAFVSGA